MRLALDSAAVRKGEAESAAVRVGAFDLLPDDPQHGTDGRRIDGVNLVRSVIGFEEHRVTDIDVESGFDSISQFEDDAKVAGRRIVNRVDGRADEEVDITHAVIVDLRRGALTTSPAAPSRIPF